MCNSGAKVTTTNLDQNDNERTCVGSSLSLDSASAAQPWMQTNHSVLLPVPNILDSKSQATIACATTTTTYYPLPLLLRPFNSLFPGPPG